VLTRGQLGREPQSGFGRSADDLLEADFRPGANSGLPVIRDKGVCVLPCPDWRTETESLSGRRWSGSLENFDFFLPETGLNLMV
jgi:hypothetical protein